MNASSSLVDFAPRDTTPGRYRYFLRDELQRDRAPLRRARRFVAERWIGLQ